MPIKKAAKKFMKTSAKKQERNMIVKVTMRSAIKAVKDAVKAGKLKEAKELSLKAVKAIDKAAQKKVIKKNNAARRKSRLAKMLKDQKK